MEKFLDHFVLEKHVVIGDETIKDCCHQKIPDEDMNFHIDWVLVNGAIDKILVILEQVMQRSPEKPLYFSLIPSLNVVPNLGPDEFLSVIKKLEGLQLTSSPYGPGHYHVLSSLTGTQGQD